MTQNVKLYFINLVIAAIFIALLAPAGVFAADLTSTSLSLGDPRTDETSTYNFDASSYTASTIECVQLVFTANADGTGGTPSGMTTTSSSLDSATAITAGSWTVDNSTNGTLGATFSTGETPSDGNIVWGNVTNGDTEGTTYYATFTSYAQDDCSTGPTDSALLAFVYKDGELVELTIDPTLTFTCNAVGASQAVNGSTTTHASTASGIDYERDVTTSTNGVSAHDIDVETNAPGGYSVYIRHTQPLTNASSDTITNHTGTHGSPSLFSAAGTESWGYTTEDSTLAGGTADRFTNPGNFWAGFNTSNDVVMDFASATPSTQTTRIGHQVGIAADTPAGTYQTVIIYSVVATF